jgi:hypothetical protein
MDAVLTASLSVFTEYAGKMSKSTARQGWANFLEQTVHCYIQCMLNSSSKIRAKSSEVALAKIREDYDKIA